MLVLVSTTLVQSIIHIKILNGPFKFYLRIVLTLLKNVVYLARRSRGRWRDNLDCEGVVGNRQRQSYVKKNSVNDLGGSC